MRNIDGLLGDGNLRDVYLGLSDILRKGYDIRGVPGVFCEDDFAHSLTVEKGAACVAARYGFDMSKASVQGFVHEFPEYKYGDKIPGEVDLTDKKESETEIMRDVCGRSKDLSGLFPLWEDFDSQKSDMGRNCYWVDKSITSPAVVAYQNNMDSIVQFYGDNPGEFKALLGLKRYKGIAETDIFDVMHASFEEFHGYAINHIGVGPVFVDAINEVRGMKTKDVGVIFERFYEVLAGDAWGKVCERDFYVDRLAYNKVGLRKMRVFRDEVSELIG